MAYVFGADDIKSALGLTAAAWDVQDSSDSEQGDIAVARNNVGAYLAVTDLRHNVRNEKTITLKCNVATGASASFTLGGDSAVVLTQVTVRQVHNDFAVITATAHQHAEGSDHIAGTSLSQAVSITGLGFGVAAVKLGGTLADCQSAEWTFTMEHVEVQDKDGEHSIGASFGFKVDATEEYLNGEDEITPTGSWKLDSQDVKTGNADYQTRSVKAHAYSWT